MKNNKYYCAICGKQVDAYIENLDIKNDLGYINLTKIRIKCCSKIQTIRIYNENK